MVKTVIFDLGGVLIDNPSSQMFAHFETTLGLPSTVLYPSIQKYWKEWERGDLLESELWQLVGNDLGRTFEITDSLWLNGFLQAHKEKPEMFELLRRLKTNGYQTALLSNIEFPIMQFIQSRNYQHLDSFIFSCVVKMSKPDRDIYDYTLALLHAKPEETIFIDDKEENIQTANSIGIHGLYFQNHSTLQNDLKKLLGEI